MDKENSELEPKPKKGRLWLIILIGAISLAGGIFYWIRRDRVQIPKNTASQVCSQIVMNDTKLFCLAEVNHDESYCQKIEGPDKNVCMAIIRDDPSFCLRMDSENQLNCFQSLVSATGKAQYCDQATKIDQITSCYIHFVSTNYFVGASSIINPEMCNKIDPSAPEKNLCLAMTTGEKKYCGVRVDCISMIEKDELLCSKSVSDRDLAECYHAVALLTKKDNLCDKITQNDMRDDCYLDYSRMIKYESFCDKIDLAEAKAKCLKNVAVNLSK